MVAALVAAKRGNEQHLSAELGDTARYIGGRAAGVWGPGLDLFARQPLLVGYEVCEGR